jgi:YVTN family beta-propeller protein/autotransporter-associated beta strand protein
MTRAALLGTVWLGALAPFATDDAHAQQGPFLYVPNGGSNSVTVIDTPANTTVPPAIAVGSQPITAAVRGDESLVYVTNIDSNSVSAINTATNAVVATINVGTQPFGVAVSPDGARAYVTNSGGGSNNVSVINIATNTVVATIAGFSSPLGVAISPDGTRAYVANGVGTVSVIDTATNAVIGFPISVGSGPVAVAFSPDGTRAYVTNNGSNSVSVINTATNSVVATIAGFNGPAGVAFSPDGTRAYVTNFNAFSNSVSVIDTATNTVVTTITGFNFPVGVVFSPDGTRAYVTNFNGGNVSVIDTATNTIVGAIPAGNNPERLGICSNGNALLASGLTFKANTSGALACTLASGASGASGPVFTGGTLQIAGANIASALPITLQSQGGTIDTNGNNATLSGTISGPGSLTKIGLGTLTLSGSSTYAGATNVNAGTLQAGAVNALSPLSAFTVASGATLDLNNFNQTIGSLAGAGSVTLGAATLTSGNDNTSTTFAGTMSGTGGLAKTGAGILMLTGANTYSGTTTINAGTLQLGNGGTTGSIAGNVVNNGTFAINRSDTFSFGGVISGAGAFQQNGTGTTILTAANSYSGATTVNAGTLTVNGSIANSAVTVNAGAMLAGIGTVGATTIMSGGTFAPGNSPGTMTVQGNLAFQSGALYVVQINSSTASSTNVTGSAALAGTVQAAFAAGSYATRTYTILSAAGGLGGTTFNALTTSNLPAGFTASLSYTATDAILNLTATLGQLVGPTSSGPGAPSGPGALACAFSLNQCNVANALNAFFNNGGALPPPFVTIFNLTGANLANALTLLSGEAATGAQQGAFQLTNQFLGVMLDPFVDGRSGVGGGGAIGFAPAREELPEDIALAYAKILKEPPKPVAFEQRWSVWGAGYGGSNRTSGDVAVVGSHDLAAATAGGAAGLDYRLAPGTVVGFALAGAGTNWGLAQGLGGGKSDAFQAGLYGTTRWGSAYVAAALAFTNHWMSTDRFASRQITSARASTRSRSAAAWKAAIASRPSMAGSRPTPRSRRKTFTRRAIPRPISPAAVLRSALIHATRPTPAASWAGASTGCCCSTPRPHSPCARAWPGRTTGSAIPRSPRCSRRFPARASSSTARRRRRIPRSPPPAPSFASPTASCCSPNSTASSPPTPRPTPAPAPCDTRGRQRAFLGRARPDGGAGELFFAARKSPTQINPVEPLLDRAMGFDKAHVRVHGQILRHRRVGVEPYRRQATAPGLADGMIHELAPQTFAPPRRVDRNVVDEVCIGFGPGDHIAVDRSRRPDHHDTAGGDLRGKVGHHRRRLASIAPMRAVSSAVALRIDGGMLLLRYLTPVTADNTPLQRRGRGGEIFAQDTETSRRGSGAFVRSGQLKLPL